jgi:hypothetical protein
MDDFKVIGGVPSAMTFGMPGIENIIESSLGAQRARLMAQEWIAINGFAGGHYMFYASASLGTAVAANSAIFSLRWALGNSVLTLKHLRMGWMLTTALTAAQLVDFDVIRANAWTVSDSGGTAITPLGTSNRKRTQWMSNSQLADARITSGAALTAGTRTLDANGFGILPQGPQPAANTIFSTGVPMLDLYKEDEQAEHPQTFGNNEGFIIRNRTATPAAGAIQVYIEAKFVEAPNY